MKTVKLLVLIQLLVIALSSCEKEENTQSGEINNGVYSGTFTVEYSGSIKTDSVSVEFIDGKYQSSSGENYIPAGGSGEYEIVNDSIVFSDENFWTANFDGNLILNGKYGFTYKNGKLSFSAYKNGVGFYKYELEKNKNN